MKQVLLLTSLLLPLAVSAQAASDVCPFGKMLCGYNPAVKKLATYDALKKAWCESENCPGTLCGADNPDCQPSNATVDMTVWLCDDDDGTGVGTSVYMLDGCSYNGLYCLEKPEAACGRP
ncbi:hypothetical protein BT63DRAFT_438719 [Microthyrium microscopicum]|uniref:Uncharacterized protein n=1 Tax=Microthyrium microscopicum TaxID=703497 RepID=A0A6A6UJI7_9PEZI|nr:hypothetical protein BT63DRAFT_438719 [Microthyrium microscopicum]